MTGTQLAARIRWYTGTNSTTFTNGDMLPLVNTVKDEIASAIVERNAGYFLIPSTFDLVVDRREYGFDDDLLHRIHKLEIKFAAADSRFPAKFLKYYSGSETESEITKNYTNSPGEFYYTIRRRALFILSGTIIAVTEGGRLLSYIFPADLANVTGSTGLEADPTTTSFGMPRRFHELWARQVSILWKSKPGNKVPLSEIEKNYANDLETALREIARPDESGEIIGKLPDATDLYNDGWDL